LGLQARQFLDQSNHGQALEVVRRARSIGDAADLRLLEAEILIASQRESEALPLLAGPAGNEGARQAMLLGWLMRRKGEWAEAKEKLAWALEKAHQSGDRRTEIMARVQLASGLAAQGQLPAAAAELTRASAVASQFGDANLKNIVRFTQASVLTRQGEAERSTELYRQIADDAERRSDLVVLSKALDNMAINYKIVGDYERALEYNRKALETFDKLDLPDSKMQGHGSRGRLLIVLERPAEAAVELEEALRLARRRGNPAEVRRWAENLTVAWLDLDRVDEAERLTTESLALDSSWPYSLANRGVIHERRGRLAEARRDWETVLANPKCPDELHWEAEYRLARLHAAANERAAAGRRYRLVLKQVDRAWASLRTDDSRLTFLTGARVVYQSYVSALIRWGNDAEALRVEESSRARLLGEHDARSAGAEALSRLAARSKSVFLAYWIAPEGGSHVRVITGGRGERVPLTAVDPKEIRRLVREHGDLVERQLGDPREGSTAAARLYDLLVKPVEARIPAGSRVVVVPDDALHRLNFETLVRRKGFWIEDVTLQVAPSLSLLEEQPATHPGRLRLLLMGDALAAPGFGKLDHAAAEMKMVRDIFGEQSVTELSGAAAQPSAYASASPGSATHIHFTAHAQANRESPLDSAVILTPERDLRYRLLAREVAAIPLHAGLVTVSACRSAGDRDVYGEGMVGFAWAFLRAGASNVVAGLWDVNDRSTARLMGELYASMHVGKPATEALRAAKLSFILGGKNYAKPYYWAPFQVYSRSLTRR
jgi:CHAT domain-containing protein/Tfp pilus assembly protein PilF